VATHTCSSEFKERLFSYTWKAGALPSNPSGFTFAGTDVEASVYQLCDIIYRRGDRNATNAPYIPAFFPYLRYSHLVLQDYLSQSLPDPMVACAEDRNRQQWLKDPRGYDQGLYSPNYGTSATDPSAWRWPYSSNYWVTVSSFDNNPINMRASPADYSHIFIGTTQSKYGGRRMTDIQYPGNKVFMYEQFGRHIGKFTYATFFGFNTARCSIQMFDNSVSIRATSDANEGCNPNTPLNPTPPTIVYNPPMNSPDPWHPNPPLALPYYQYTSSGLRGIDFAGRPIRIEGY
jgi:hypothetical protein